MGTCIFHNSIGVIVREKNDHLFSEWVFGCNLNLPSFGGQFIEHCIVDLNDFLVQKSRKSFLYF